MISDHHLLLKNTLSFWDFLSFDEQNTIIENIRLITYEAGTNIHRADMNCLGLIIIKSGCIRSYMLSEQGRDITLYRLRSGETCVLSASCLLKNITFDIHIDIEEPSEVLVIPSNILSQLMNQNIYIENFTYKIVTVRFSDVMWTMEQILFMSFDRRLAIFLLDESQKQQTTTLTLTHEQIAKYVGSAREVVSRMLKYFASEGLITLKRGKIIITNSDKLKEISS